MKSSTVAKCKLQNQYRHISAFPLLVQYSCGNFQPHLCCNGTLQLSGESNTPPQMRR